MRRQEQAEVPLKPVQLPQGVIVLPTPYYITSLPFFVSYNNEGEGLATVIVFPNDSSEISLSDVEVINGVVF